MFAEQIALEDIVSCTNIDNNFFFSDQYNKHGIYFCLCFLLAEPFKIFETAKPRVPQISHKNMVELAAGDAASMSVCLHTLPWDLENRGKWSQGETMLMCVPLVMFFVSDLAVSCLPESIKLCRWACWLVSVVKF